MDLHLAKPHILAPKSATQEDIKGNRLTIGYQSLTSSGTAEAGGKKLESSTNQRTLFASYDVILNDGFSFEIHAGQSQQNFEGNGKRSLDWTVSSDSSFLAYGAGPSLKWNNLVLGGNIDINYFGNSNRSQTHDFGLKENTTTRLTVIPTFNLFAQLFVDEYTLATGFKVFNQGNNEISYRDNSGTNHTIDSHARSPGNLWFALGRTFGNMSLEGDINYVTDGQASPALDEETPTVRAGQALLTGPKRNANHYETAFGGSYRASPDFHLISAIHLIGSSYSKTEYASLEHQNLRVGRINALFSQCNLPVHGRFLGGLTLVARF